MVESLIDWEGEQLQRDMHPDADALTDEESGERPTIEDAARVLFEAICHCDVPEFVTQAMATWAADNGTRPPVWRELSDEQRAFWVQVMHGCVVASDRFDDEPSLHARILVLYPDAMIAGQSELSL